MASQPIRINYGETVTRSFLVQGKVLSETDDVLFFVVRNKAGDVLYWQIMYPVWSEDEQGYLFNLTITHADSEAKLPVGSHKFGVALYQGVVFDEHGVPDDGTVTIPAARWPFVVRESIPREQGVGN